MTIIRVRDDLGTVVKRPAIVRRVVSLVPSLTEAIALTREESIVAATDWCTHPEGLDVMRIRGTKNPHCSRIVDLSPDLVIANMEENRKIDIERLRKAGVSVWVTRIESVAEAFASMRRMFVQGLGWNSPSWLDMAQDSWDKPTDATNISIAVPIWRDPWMVVGRETFAGDMLTSLGFNNAFEHSEERYPKVPIESINVAGIDLVLLPDEPYRFSESDGPEAFTIPRVELVSGRLLTWYGPSLIQARDTLMDVIARGSAS